MKIALTDARKCLLEAKGPLTKKSGTIVQAYQGFFPGNEYPTYFVEIENGDEIEIVNLPILGTLDDKYLSNVESYLGFGRVITSRFEVYFYRNSVEYAGTQVDIVISNHVFDEDKVFQAYCEFPN